jgi:hypothetical protein
MSLVGLVIVLVLCGLIVYFVDKWPIASGFKMAIKIVAIVVAVYYVLVAFGIWGMLMGINVPLVK